jgi:hypothetical protein
MNILIERNICEHVYVISVPVHTDMLGNQNQEKKCIVIIIAYLLTEMARRWWKNL